MRRSRTTWAVGAVILGLAACGDRDGAGGDDPAGDGTVEAFLDRYEAGFQPLAYASAQAWWTASTDVSEPHTAAAVAADKALSAYTGAADVVTAARDHLAGDAATDLRRRQQDLRQPPALE
ncbi:MAG: hypothetical protein ACF8XB_15220, partial [Planctomycetota bacterium JB042]